MIVVIADAVAHFPCEVESLAVFFQMLYNTHALLAMYKTALTQFVERPLSRVSKRCVSQIVSQCDRLHQIFV